MTPKTQQNLHPYSVKIETATGKSAIPPLALLTPKQVEEVQLEFKRLAQEAGIKGAHIDVQRVIADDYRKVIHEHKAHLEFLFLHAHSRKRLECTYWSGCSLSYGNPTAQPGGK